MNAEVKINNLIIGAVPANCIDMIWDKCIPHIEKVSEVSHGDITVDKTYERLLKGDNLLVTISEGSEVIAVNVLQVDTMDNGIRTLSIPITGGSRMEEWMERFLEIAKAIAKDFKCDELRGFAVRRGWLRKLQPYGWEEHFVTIKCKVGD